MNLLREKVEKKFDLSVKIKIEELKTIVQEIINHHFDLWNKTKNIPTIPLSYNEQILHKYQDFINEVIKSIFEEIPLTRNDIIKLKKTASYLFSKFPDSIAKNNLTSGIVIAGFGEKEVYPAFIAYDIEGIANNKLKFREIRKAKITLDRSATIAPFAQRDVIDTFIQGADPKYVDIEQSYLTKMLYDFSELIIDKTLKVTKKRKNELIKKLKNSTKELLACIIHKF